MDFIVYEAKEYLSFLINFVRAPNLSVSVPIYLPEKKMQTLLADLCYIWGQLIHKTELFYLESLGKVKIASRFV